MENRGCVFPICEPSPNLKCGVAYTPQILLLPVHVRIGDIMASNILRAKAVFSFLRFVYRLKLKRAWRAFFLRYSCDTEKFPDEDFRSMALHLKKVSIRSYHQTNISSHWLKSYTIMQLATLLELFFLNNIYWLQHF